MGEISFSAQKSEINISPESYDIPKTTLSLNIEWHFRSTNTRKIRFYRCCDLSNQKYTQILSILVYLYCDSLKFSFY